MNNLIQEVKNKVDIIDIAKIYGLELKRGNKCLCPFHNEKTPSLSISQSKQIWHCFGCGEGGDCISLVAKLLKINNYEAAKDINFRLNLGLITNYTNQNYKKYNEELDKYKQDQLRIQNYKKWENKAFQYYCDYLHQLENLIIATKPNLEKEDISNACLYVIEEKIKVEDILDNIFLSDNVKEKVAFYKAYRKEHKV